MNRVLSTLVDNLSEINNRNCEESKDKDLKIKVEEPQSKKIVRTMCKTCKSKETQLVYDLIKKFSCTYKLCNNKSKKFIFFLKKGIYQYEYMDSMDRFDQTEVPSIEKCYSSLQMKHISENEYKHARKVWEIFDIKTLGEYHDLYVQANVAQLSAVLESFNSVCLKEYQLDPAYFLSTPKITEKGICGGLTQVIRRHGIANNKYLPDYDSSKKSNYLQCLDANNLYGYSMNKKLPLNRYKRTDTAIFTDEFIKNYNDNDDKGYLLEVDVVYPKELPSVHRDLLFLPEKRSKRRIEYEYKVSNGIKKALKKGIRP